MIPPHVSRESSEDDQSSLVSAVHNKHGEMAASARHEKLDPELIGVALSDSETGQAAEGRVGGAARMTKTAAAETPRGYSKDSTEDRRHGIGWPAAGLCASTSSTASSGDDTSFSARFSSVAKNRVDEVEEVRGWEPRRRSGDGRATVRVFVAGRNGLTTTARLQSRQTISNAGIGREEGALLAESEGGDGRCKAGEHASETKTARTFDRRHSVRVDDEAHVSSTGGTEERQRPAVPSAASATVVLDSRALKAGYTALDRRSPSSRMSSPLKSADRWAKLKVSIPTLDKMLSGGQDHGPPTSSLTPPPRFSQRECHAATVITGGLGNDANKPCSSQEPEEHAAPHDDQLESTADSDRCNESTGNARLSSNQEAAHDVVMAEVLASETSNGESKTVPAQARYKSDENVSGDPLDPGGGAGGGGGGDEGDRGDHRARGGGVEPEATREERTSIKSPGGSSGNDASPDGKGSPALSPQSQGLEETHGSIIDGADKTTHRGSVAESGCEGSNAYASDAVASAADGGVGEQGGTATIDAAAEGQDTRRHGTVLSANYSPRTDKDTADGPVDVEGKTEEGGTVMSVKDAESLVAAKAAAAASSPPPACDKRESKSESMVEVTIRPSGECIYRLKSGAPRRGKWCQLEQDYAKRIINDFDEGLLDVEPGTGLRQLLASKLQCEVMRVSKKFCGLESVGKRSYRPRRNQDTRAEWARANLFRMEQRWLKSFFPSTGASKSANENAPSAPSGELPKGLMRLVPAPLPEEPDAGMAGFERHAPSWRHGADIRDEARNSFVREEPRFNYDQSENDDPYAGLAARDAAYGAARWLLEEERHGPRGYVDTVERYPDVDFRPGGHHPASRNGRREEQRWPAGSSADERLPEGVGDRGSEGWHPVSVVRGDARREGRGCLRHDRQANEWFPRHAGSRGLLGGPNIVGGYVSKIHDHADDDQHGPLRSAGWSHASGPAARKHPPEREFPRRRDYPEGETGTLPAQSRQPQAGKGVKGVCEDETWESLYPIYSTKDRYDTADARSIERQGRVSGEVGSTLSHSFPPQPLRGGVHQTAPVKRPCSPFMITRRDGDASRDPCADVAGSSAGGGGSGWRERYGKTEAYSAAKRCRQGGYGYNPAYGSSTPPEVGHDDYPSERYDASRTCGYNPDEREHQHDGRRGIRGSERRSNGTAGGQVGWHPVEHFRPSQQHLTAVQRPPHLGIDANSSNSVFFSGESGVPGSPSVTARNDRRKNSSGEVLASTPSGWSTNEGAPRRAVKVEQNEDETRQEAGWAISPQQRPVKSRRLPGYFVRGTHDGRGGNRGGEGGAGGDGSDGGHVHQDSYRYSPLEQPKRRWAEDLMYSTGLTGGTASSERWSELKVGGGAAAPPYHCREGSNYGSDRGESSFSVPVGGGIVMPREGHVVLRVEGQRVVGRIARGNEVQGTPDHMARQR